MKRSSDTSRAAGDEARGTISPWLWSLLLVLVLGSTADLAWPGAPKWFSGVVETCRVGLLAVVTTWVIAGAPGLGRRGSRGARLAAAVAGLGVAVAVALILEPVLASMVGLVSLTAGLTIRVRLAAPIGAPRIELVRTALLLLLFPLSLTSPAVLVPEADWWVPVLGRHGVAALISLVLAWGIDGFSGYERVAGQRILRRPGARGPAMLGVLVVALLVAVAGVIALHLEVRSAALAVLVALASGTVMVVVLSQRFAVSSTLSMVGIAIGVAALIVVQSVATGFQHEFERRVLGVYAHINVTRSFGISEYRRFEAYLRTIPGVVGASPFVYYAMALAPVDPEGEREGDIRRASVLVKGIEPQTAHEVIDLADHLEAGGDDSVEIADLRSELVLQPIRDREDDRLPPVIAATPDPRGPSWYEAALRAYRAQPDHLKYGRRRAVALDEDEWPLEVEGRDPADDLDPETLPTMFVGVTLARELELAKGDVVSLVDPGATFDTSEAPEFRHYRVAGVFRAGFQEYDSRLVYVHIKELQYFKYRGKDTVSGIDLRLADPYEAPEVEQVLRQTIGDDEYSILEWQKLNANLFQSIRTQKSILTVILSLVSTVAGFNVLAALWTMVVRRTAEIAILSTMGSSEGGVARIFQFAGMSIGAVGSVAGVGFGLVLCWLVELYGYTLDPEVYFIEHLPVEISVDQVGIVLLVTMAISFFATVPPSLRAAKLRPVEGLRFE
ncbi:MAG: ABC transporter permease [Myxococcales bacterium]|nr:ABC transporter permease [Myxococcales bacterium]MCB9716351.1 ABC transporter permease [Myxococcales bacterium]